MNQGFVVHTNAFRCVQWSLLRQERASWDGVATDTNYLPMHSGTPRTNDITSSEGCCHGEYVLTQIKKMVRERFNKHNSKSDELTCHLKIPPELTFHQASSARPRPLRPPRLTTFKDRNNLLLTYGCHKLQPTFVPLFYITWFPLGIIIPFRGTK